MAKKQENAGSERTAPSVSEVVAFCRKLSLTAEQVGRWVWVSFAEKPDEAMRGKIRLKTAKTPAGNWQTF